MARRTRAPAKPLVRENRSITVSPGTAYSKGSRVTTAQPVAPTDFTVCCVASPV